MQLIKQIRLITAELPREPQELIWHLSKNEIVYEICFLYIRN